MLWRKKFLKNVYTSTAAMMRQYTEQRQNMFHNSQEEGDEKRKRGEAWMKGNRGPVGGTANFLLSFKMSSHYRSKDEKAAAVYVFTYML